MPTTYAIPNGRTVFDATTFTANASTNTISNVDKGTTGFQPDFVWTKSRTDAYSHELFDSIRGVTKILYSNSNIAEATDANSFLSFNSNGFTLGYNNGANYTNGSLGVAWNWKAGGTAVSNTSGTITSSVSANTTAGFSIVTYTGNGGNNQTVGHGLGVAPQFIIVKNRSASFGWDTWHGSIPTKAGTLNTADDFQTGSYAAYGFNEPASSSTFPTSSVFYISASGRTYNSDITNGNGNTFVAYCWSPIAGYSAFGSYAGNSSSDGPFIYTGFRPKFFLIKKYTNNDSTVAHWQMFDSSRNTYNITNTRLNPDTTEAEATDGGQWDFLSNGIKVRSSDTYTNKTGESYLYAAFAENPFKYANAR